MQKNFKNYKTSSRLHFKTKRVWTDRKIENKKNFLPIRSNPTRVREFKNNCKKILKLKNISQSPFQDKTGLDRPKNRAQKNFLPTRSNPARVREFKNKCKKNLKINKHPPGFISRRNGPVQAEKGRTKIISSLSIRTRPELENSKINAKKFQKLKENPPGFISRRNGPRQAKK